MNYQPPRILNGEFIKSVVLNLVFFVKKPKSQPMYYVQVRFSRPKLAKILNLITFSERVWFYL